MTDEELIARLRELASFESGVGVMQDFYCGDEMVVAADRIEALVKERDEADRRAGAAERSLESDRETLRRLGHWRDRQKEARGYPHTISFDVVWTETCAKADRYEAAEAKLVKAVEALREIEKRASETNRLGAVTGGHWTRLTVACLNARAALAELDGK